jgi:hypothetical protein
MTKSDFAVVPFGEGGEQLGARDEANRFLGTVFVGNQSSVQEFTIDGVPTDRGYVLIQTAEIEAFDHQVLINGRDIDSGTDLPAGASKTFQTPMAILHQGLLQRGKNTIQIKRGTRTQDSFAIYSAVIHWRERDPLRLLLSPEVLRALLDASE